MFARDGDDDRDGAMVNQMSEVNHVCSVCSMSVLLQCPFYNCYSSSIKLNVTDRASEVISQYLAPGAYLPLKV